MSPAETTRVREARRADVLEEIRTRFPVEGQKITVTMAGHGLYSRARRAFGGSWRAALEAAGKQPSDAHRGFGGDATAMFKNMDAISSNPLPGLPRHLRERQILGGMILERFAKTAEQARRQHVVHDLGMGEEARGASSSAERMLGQALLWALHRYHLTHMKHERGALAEIAITSSDGETTRVDVAYNPGETTGDIDLPDARPVEHVDG